jgi:hypothetical protein
MDRGNSSENGWQARGRLDISLRAVFVANRDDVGEELAGLEDIENTLRFLFRDLDPCLGHYLNHQWVEPARFQAGTLSFEIFAADLVQPGLGHLAASTVVNTNEKNPIFHRQSVPLSCRNKRPGV